MPEPGAILHQERPVETVDLRISVIRASVALSPASVHRDVAGHQF